MTVTRFEGAGPVARYWLAHCEGFAVKGATKGVVEELIRDADPHVTTRLVIRTGGHRRKVVSASAVTAVVPAQKLVVVERLRKPRRQQRRKRRQLHVPPVLVRVALRAEPPLRAALAVLAHSLRLLGAEVRGSVRLRRRR